MGTYACYIQNGMLVANLANYAAGAAMTEIDCQGLCVKQ
jgi:hypothetical protein